MDIFSVLGQMLLGWLFADFVGGVIHWLEDRVAWEGMPLLSRFVVEPNRQHHRDPLAFVGANWWSRNWTSWAAVALISSAVLCFNGFSAFWLAATVGGLVMSEIHRAAHAPAMMPKWVRVLQDMGIFQSPRQHGRHHRGDMNRAYCVLSNWLNPLLDWLGVWERVERAMSRVGLEPNRGMR